MKLDIAGKRAIVLGASKGLGAAIAIALANEGVEVIGGARSNDAIPALNGQLEAGAAGRVTGIRLDLSDPASVASFITAVDAGGGADIVVNNSGGPAPGEAGAIPASEFSRVVGAPTQPRRAMPASRTCS